MALAALIASTLLLAAGPAHPGPAPILLAQAEQPLPTRDRNPDVQTAADALVSGEDPFPAGAPTDDYGLIAWCYGALAGHLDLHDQVMPEVERIEGQIMAPGETIGQIMNDYAVARGVGRGILANYGRILELKEAAGSADPAGRAAAVAHGRDAWKGAESTEPRRLAQLWMSWGLPARCETTSARLLPTN